MNLSQPSDDPEKQLDRHYLQLEADLAFGIDRMPKKPEYPAAPPEPKDLSSLERQVQACQACPLWEHRKQAVFGTGDLEAGLLFVGEAPGYEEDRVGEPFVGKAGQLLNRMIQAMGFSRESVYIANVLKCRPPDNRTPSPREIEACRNYLEDQIRRIAPKVIVTLGAPATRTLLEREEGISTLRGRAYPYKKIDGVSVVPTFHPAYLLRNPAEKGKAWEDLQRAMALLGGDVG